MLEKVEAASRATSTPMESLFLFIIFGFKATLFSGNDKTFLGLKKAIGHP
jgi:hypothetical protein